MPQPCKLVVGSVQRGDETLFPLNAGGWAAAHRLALEKASRNSILALVDLACTRGRIALYQCHTGYADRRRVSCVIESPGASRDPGASPGIAGHQRTRRKTRRRRA